MATLGWDVKIRMRWKKLDEMAKLGCDGKIRMRWQN